MSDNLRVLVCERIRVALDAIEEQYSGDPEGPVGQELKDEMMDLVRWDLQNALPETLLGIAEEVFQELNPNGLS